jgi:hypothetical protein
MTNKYNINILCVVLSTNIINNKQFVLSMSSDQIKLPTFECNPDFLNNTNVFLINYLKQYIFVSDIELLPQIINIENKHNCKDDTINIVYGFITKNTASVGGGAQWLEFSYQQPNLYSDILLEVTNKLK